MISAVANAEQLEIWGLLFFSGRVPKLLRADPESTTAGFPVLKDVFLSPQVHAISGQRCATL
jgi:hypothetical protein